MFFTRVGTLGDYEVPIQGMLCVTVADTGIGLSKNIDLNVGLANIKERLDILYQNQAELIFTENHPHGLKVIIEIHNFNPNKNLNFHAITSDEITTNAAAT